MTLSTTTSQVLGLGNGSTTVFAFGFIIPNIQSIQVTLTSSAGVQTVLPQSQYAVTGLGVPTGGSVTYPISGSPLAIGNSLLIQRIVPLDQNTSLQNQGSYLPSAVEAALDYEMMAIQQVQTEQSFAIMANPANSVAPQPLPPAAQAAGLSLIFDSTGNNVIAGNAIASGVVSSAMQPVINAATLAAGRTAFGLGSVAVENIGPGLQDNGSGSLIVNSPVVADSTAQAVTTAFHESYRIVSPAVAYTLPKASTLFNGFGFWVNCVGGAATFVVNAADSFTGQASGASYVVAKGAVAYVTTNGSASGTWYPTLVIPISQTQIAPPQGRLTLSSGAPVLTGTVAAATSVLYTPYVGNQVPIWNGSIFVPTFFAETTQALSDTTLSPAAAVAASVYDYFAWSNAGTIVVTRGPAWTNGTTRGYTLTRVNGILTNTSAITNGPAAGYGTYVGTVATDSGAGTVTYKTGGAASGGVGAFLNVWNCYNRVVGYASVQDTGAGYNISAGAWEAARGSTNNRVTFVTGLAEDAIDASYAYSGTFPVVATASIGVSMALDSTTVPVKSQINTTSGLAYVNSSTLTQKFAPQVGSHFIQALEYSNSTSVTMDAFSDNLLFAEIKL